MARSGVTMLFFVARDVRSVVVVARASPSSFAPAPHREASVTVMHASSARSAHAAWTPRRRSTSASPRRARPPRVASAAPPPRIRDPVVIYEDDDVLAVHKPAGMSFHNDDLEHHRPGVLGTLRELQARGALPGSDYDGPLHAVHRLDKVTSGALLFAKAPDAAAALAAEFRARRVHKYYVALSARRPSKKMGTVAGDMARTRRGAWKLLRRKNASDSESGGNPRSEPGLKTRTNTPPAAVTRFVARGVAGVDGRPLRMFVMRPLTGKTHQLRVACKSLGSPILGDASYAGAGAGAEDRAYLHAAAIRFAMPARDGSGRRIVEVVCAPTEGVEWSTETFQEAWAASGLGRLRGRNIWFPENALLRSSADELFEDDGR